MTPTLIIITLILFGVIALLAEFLIFTGIGISGILGLASLIYSSVYAFQNLGAKAGTIVTAIDVVIVIIMLVVMLKEKTWKRLELKDEIKASVQNDSQKVSLGQKGQSLTRLAPRGTVRFEGLSCEVCSADGKLIDPETEVEVVSIENNQILVKPVNN